MKLEFIKYVVNTETDFIEDGIQKINVHLTVVSKSIADVNNIMPVLTSDVYVVNLNTQTGVEMDNQRLEASINFLNNLA